ncbi:MAG: hypothetical protein ABIM42_08560 [candidate division WOR-3 bacterium]
MDTKKLNEAMEFLKSEIGAALITSGVIKYPDGISILSHNPNPKIAALTAKMTQVIEKTLDAGNMKLGKYYLFHLTGNKLALAIPLGEYIWGMIVDMEKTQLGYLLHVVIDELITKFEEAIAG